MPVAPMEGTYPDAIKRALKGTGPFSRPVTEAILEIAYLTMAVDQELRDEELAAFQAIALQLSGRADEAAMIARLDALAHELDRASILERLEQTARTLGDDRAAKLAAYRVSCLMAMSDLDAADREFEFDLDLIATLGLAQEDADAIADEVNAAVTPAE